MPDITISPLDNVVKKLRLRIQDPQRRNMISNEQNTKIVLINPLLAALGWDIENLEEVTYEYRRKSQDNPVDYALFLLRSPKLFVEAKSLGGDLSSTKYVNQMLGYAVVVGVEWCVLTNGDEYRLYNANAPVDSDEKLFRTVRISDATKHADTVETLQLLSKERMSEQRLTVLWNAHFVDRRVRVVLGDFINNQDAGLIRLIRKKLPELSRSDILSSLQRANIQIDFPTNLVGDGSHASRRTRGNAAAASRKKERGVESKAHTRKAPQAVPVTLTDLIDASFIVPPLEISSSYLGQSLVARVTPNGSVAFAGTEYASLSEAAGMARVSVKGPPEDGRPYYQTNGWTFWKFLDDSLKRPVELDKLRKRFLAAKATS